ncbi:MAG: YbhB/YbcL family Raf kinase inhibitor-like protein [Thermaurantiacus sp.]
MPRTRPLLTFVLAAYVVQAGSLRAEMQLDLPDVKRGALQISHVASGYGCDGLNQSPEMIWTGAPPETKSFIVSAYDPDAPTGSGFWHWMAFDIPPSVAGLAEGAGGSDHAMPSGSVLARNDFSMNRYDGACPPEGSTHRYVFTVYAMPMEHLPINASASAAMVGYFANTAALAKASVVAVYGR